MKVLQWDWRSQPDLDELDDAVRAASDGQVAITQVDTGSDEYAVVVGPPMSREQAREAWEGERR